MSAIQTTARDVAAWPRAATNLPFIDSAATPLQAIGGPGALALVLIAAFVVGLGFWSITAPLMSAAVASGSIMVESNRKTIQHLEGGIVAEILVRDGDNVELGQPLVRLDDIKARTSLVALQGQLTDAEAAEARLMAERDGHREIEFPTDLVHRAAEPQVATAMDGQRSILSTRQSLQSAKIRQLDRRISQIDEEIIGHSAVIRSASQQRTFISEERGVVAELVGKGLATKPRLLALDRTAAELEGKMASAKAQIARARQSISESEVAKFNVRSDAAKEVEAELRQVQGKLHELREKAKEAQDVMQRTWVRAPLGGTVTDLRIHTLGGVINRGDPILDIVPGKDRIVVEVQLRPEDIAAVHSGLSAQVHLLPYKQRRMPPISGTVIHVAADRLIDKVTNRPYYPARIALSDLPENVHPVPGMPCDAMIQTGESTVASYALAPLIDSMRRAFKER